jgi:hypothetical protein
MGWNSWDVFGTSVTEAETRANAEFLAEHMADHGWEYVVVDIQWYDPAARAGGYNTGTKLVLDEYGRPQPAPNRFPSAAGGAGFRPLADYVHSLGLKFGLHILRGVPRQAVAANTPIHGSEYSAAQIPDRERVSSWVDDNWGIDHSHPGGQAYYDSLVRMFAEWGVDYIKADDMIAPYWEDEVEAFWHAVDRVDRDILLSLSPGMSVSTGHAEHLQKHSHLWRISADLWDRWRDIDTQFDLLRDWAPFAGPGHWPDADMLPLGHIGIRAEVGEPRETLLAPDEQRTMLTLWCIARSPLMVGADLPTSSAETADEPRSPGSPAAHRRGPGSLARGPACRMGVGGRGLCGRVQPEHRYGRTAAALVHARRGPTRAAAGLLGAHGCRARRGSPGKASAAQRGFVPSLLNGHRQKPGSRPGWNSSVGGRAGVPGRPLVPRKGWSCGDRARVASRARSRYGDVRESPSIAAIPQGQMAFLYQP